MIFTSVDVEALRYLRARGVSDVEFEQFLLQNILFGYQRELTCRHRDGWFNAHVCDTATGSLWLTAYCLSVCSQAREFVTIDEDVLSSAARWIVGNQKPDGSWEPVGWVHNQDLYGGLQGNGALTAFVTLALASYGQAPVDSIARARSWIEDHVDAEEGPSSLAVMAYTLAVLGSPAVERTLDRLQSAALDGGEGRLHWDPVPVETTSYAALALFARDRGLPGSAAASWIALQKNGRGGFGNTQDTVMALRALVREALASTESTDAAIAVDRGGSRLYDLRIDGTNLDVVNTFLLEPGDPFTVSSTGRGQIAVQSARLFNLPARLLASRGGLRLAVDYGAARIGVDERVTARASVLYSGVKPETNMAIAEIGVPTGLRPDRAALDALVGKSRIKRVDAEARSITIYFDKFVSGEHIEVEMPFVAAFPAIAAPVSSKAYDYYDPSIEAIAEGKALVIAGPGGESAFLRGDGNSDGGIDISDVLAALEHLFLGAGASCPDAMDSNDDGSVDVADPIGILLFLFAGGKPPAYPFPDPGEDPTEDGIGCSVR